MMGATPETMGPRDFSRLLADRFKVRMSHQAVSKAGYLPKNAFGKIVVQDALVTLADRGRISLDLEATLPLDGPAQSEEEAPLAGRPRAKGNGYYDEMTLTERVRRRKLEIELAEKEGKLLRVEDVTEAMVAGARRIGERLERLSALADELTAAARSQGAPAVRDILRREVRMMREQLAEALTLAAAEDGDEEN